MYSNPGKLGFVDRWDCIVSAVSFMGFLSLACGFSFKYLSGDLGLKNGEYAADGGLPKETLTALSR